MRDIPVWLRGNVWWCSVRNPNGGRRIKKTTGCRDYKAAVERWRELERQSVEGRHQTADKTRLGDALDRRIAERKAAGRAEGTLSMLKQKSRHLTRILGAETKLSRIGAAEVDGFVQTRLDEGAARTTIYKELTTLRGALRLAKRRKEFAEDLDEVMPEFPQEYEPKKRALSEIEIEKLLAYLPKPRAAVVAFLLATAATYPSEVKTLTARDVDTKKWTVVLRGTKTKYRDRVVPIVEFARPWVTMALPHLPFAKWSNVRRDLHEACHRLSTCERCLKKGSTRRGSTCKTCSVIPAFEPISPNDLRRTLASLLRARGVEPQLIAPMLGHGDSRMVEKVYGRITPEQLAHLLRQRLREDAA